MKKIKRAFLLVAFLLFLMCLCAPLVACKEEDKQAERKRIIGIDSDKTYLKAKFYIKDRRDLNDKYIRFEILSYDEIKGDELWGVSFDTTTEEDREELSAFDYKLDEYRLGGNDKFGNEYRRYRVEIELTMKWVSYDVHINSITLNISGQEYVFSSDILFQMQFNHPNYYKSVLFTYGEGKPQKGSYCDYWIKPQYDMTLKSLSFQTDGYEILSCCIETYNANPEENEKVADSLPFTFEGGKRYSIYIEATPPQDCLYYGDAVEGVIEFGEGVGKLSGIEVKYTNMEQQFDGIDFYGSALNALD